MKIHIIGISGVGMSALAQALLDQGVQLTGSDRMLDAGLRTDVLTCLEQQGVALFPQNGTAITEQTSRVVISSAIEPSNPGRVRADSLCIPIIHRAEELARVLSGKKLIAVAGTCGKSSVTAMLGHLLAETGFDPLVVNGACVAGWDENGTRVGSVRRGNGEWAVAEVDESDKSLMVFSPEHAIITNASADHFGMDETNALFEAFRARVAGTVIDGRDAAELPQNIVLSGWEGRFDYEGVTYTLPMPGLHNVYNAWHAVRMARVIGAQPQALAAALATFGGIERRLQKIGTCGAAMVVDDYAHNPEKLAAAWKTLAGCFPQGFCLTWRPHGYGPLRKMMDDLAAMFLREIRPQDTLVLLPVYDAGGTADRSVNTDALAERLTSARGKVVMVQDIAAAESAMRACAATCGALVTCGARDPDLPALARRLVS